MMKKIIGAAVLIALLTLLAVPFLVGSKIASVSQKQALLADQRLKAMASNNGYFSDASFNIESYEKGYLNSTVKSLLRFDTVFSDDDGQPIIIKIPLISKVSHGPYLGESNFGLAKVLSYPDVSEIGFAETIQYDTLSIEDIIDFRGGINETISIKPFEHTNSEGSVLNFAGATLVLETSIYDRLTFTGAMTVNDTKISNSQDAGFLQLQPFSVDFTVNSAGRAGAGYFQFDSSEIKAEGDEGLVITLQSLNAKGTYRFAEDLGLMLGNQEIAFKTIEFNAPTVLPELLRIPELLLTNVVEQDDIGHISAAVKYDAKFDSSLMKALQSPVDVKTAGLEMRMESIPVEALRAYQKMIQLLMSIQSQSSDNTAIQEALSEIMRELINSSAVLSVALKANTDGGSLKADADIGINADHGLSSTEMMTLLKQAGSNPKVLLAILSGKGQFILDKNVTDNAGLTPIVQMMAAELVVLDGEVFKSELLIKDGGILINKQPLP